MIQLKSLQWAIAFMAAAGSAALCAVGCSSPQELNALRQESQMLSQRVDELEEQLKPADANIAVAGPDTQVLIGTSLYIVVEGDSLWSIAKKNLGSGTRYKELLALNSHITKEQPLAIGTVLRLPPR